MRKTNQWILSLLLMAVGVLNANAGERVEFTADNFTFYSYEGYGENAVKGEVYSDAAFIFGEPASCPIGDTNCEARVDLGNYSKMYVSMEGCDAEGNTNGSNPRIFINRTEHDGQFNATKDNSKCLVIPNAGTWAEDYYTVTGDGEYEIDLFKIKKDFGFVHFHSIKGSAWNTQAIVYSLEVEKADKSKQVGWTDLINNGDMEGDDVSSFFTKVSKGDPLPSTITDGAGVDGSRGIVVETTDKVSDPWDNQFWFRFNEPLIAGTKYRVSFDYRADEDAGADTQAHAEPSDYIHYDLFGKIQFTTDWQTFTKEGEVTAQQSTDAKKFLSVAFNLNDDSHPEANNYYFDNIKFEIYKAGTTALFCGDVILIDFGFDTNLPELVAQTGAKRMFFDKSSATVKVNGEAVQIFSVEGCDDGRFYIFMDDGIDDDATVEVSLTSLGLTYTGGANIGSAVPDFNGEAEWNADVQDETKYNDPYPYVMVTPTVMKTNPDAGSFNLDASTTFTITFDKLVDCAALVATANGNRMTVSPSSDFAKEVTLSGGLSDGENVIKISKIYPEERLDDSIFGEYEFSVGVGETVNDPNDQPYDVIPADYFANCAAGGIPEGFFVLFEEEERTSDSSYGSGSRMFDFGAGGDFTKGLYIREGYAEYGSQGGYELALQAGKKYTLSFNSAMWKSSGATLDLKIFNADDTETPVFSQTVNNTPDVNGSTAAVTGSTKTSIEFKPEADGNYIVRWDRPGFNEILIANVVMKYMPNVSGLEYILKLEETLNAAKATLEANGDERYLGSAYDNLTSVISKYDGWKSTSPAEYDAAVEEIEAAANALKEHRANCDEYDTQIKKAIDVVRQNAEKKFAATDLYAELKDIVAKYNGTSEWQNVSGDEENPEWQLFYEYDVLKDDNQLTAAIAELKDIANTTSLLFTEGESKTSDTGVKVATERLRLGAESLKALGDANNSLIAEANNALTDDDQIAENLKLAVKRSLYGQLMNPENTLFEGVENEETMETEFPTYDVTVFVKNPNIYKLSGNMDFTDEAVPGWIVPDGYSRPGLSCGWGATRGTDVIAEDCMFQTWGGSYRVEQTITDMPAGVYNIMIGFGERMQDDAGSNMEESYVFASNSSGEEYTADCPGIGQSFPYANTLIEEVEVTDGELTIGVNASQGSHTFFNDVRIVLTGPAKGFDYAKAYAALPEPGVKGDVNGDGAVNVADISAIISVMAGEATEYAAAADVNSDGAVNVADISAVIDIMAAMARRLAGLE